MFALRLAQLVVTSAMTGIIWLVQLVHYPMLSGIEREHFRKWHGFHSARISFLVAPLMCVELALASFGAFRSFALLDGIVFALTVGVWASTFGLSVPLHNRLSASGYDERLLLRLVATNWPRTALYTVKAAVLTFALL